MYGSLEVACYALVAQISFTTLVSGFSKSYCVKTTRSPVVLAAQWADPTDLGSYYNNSSSVPSTNNKVSKEGGRDVAQEKLDTILMTREGKTLYQILDASPTSTRTELKKKYVEMAKLSHPDAQIGMNKAMSDIPDFGEVAAAWRILGDTKSRRRYDRELQYKEWADVASNFANEKMEEAVPAVAKIMDSLALPFLRRTAATTVAVSQVVSNIAKTVDSVTKDMTDSETKQGSITDAFMNAVRAGQRAGRAIDTLELNEKSERLSQMAQKDENRAREIQKELNSVTQQRLLATIQSDTAKLSSEEARQFLDQLTVIDEGRPQNFQRIEKDIDALAEAENVFIEKLKVYEQTDREWNDILSKQQSFRYDLANRKKAEAEARKRLDEAIRMVAEAKANLVAISNSLRTKEQVVRKNAAEMDHVTFTLSKRQERVRQALRKQAKTMNSGIQLQYMSEEDLAALRRKEIQLTGENEKLGNTVARLEAQVEKLKSRAAALDSYEDSSSGDSSLGS